MRLPTIYKADNLDILLSSKAKIKNSWVIAKPYGFGCLCLFTRIKTAWKVFIGEYDCISYYKQKDNQ